MIDNPVGPGLMPALVMVPLAVAILTTLFHGQSARVISVVAAVVQLALALALVAWLSSAGGDSRYSFGGWAAPLGIELEVNGFTAIMLVLTAAIFLALSVYSCAYFHPASAARFWPLCWLLIGGLNSLFLATDAFNAYVTLEVIGLAAVALVALEGTRQALVAALRYLFVSLVGSTFYLLAVAVLYRSYGTLDIAQIATLSQPGAASATALGLITAGLLVKTAAWPLHFWLPPAHGDAPAPVSAILSALVVKASFYLLIRFWLDALAPAATDVGLTLLGAIGAGAIIWGSWRAFRAQRLKLMVAYSTVAQLGYLFLLFPLSMAEDHRGLSGAAISAITYLIVAHACAKAAMFLVAGNVLRAVGHDQIDRLQGLARLQPISLFTFAIAGVSLIGLPPSAGFIGKWMLLTAAINSGQWWWAVVIIAGGLIAAMYVFRVLNLAFVDVPDDPQADYTRVASPVSLMMIGPALVLAIAAILLGFNADMVLAPLSGDFGAIR